MPIPSLFILAFTTGVAAAIASRKELRLSPRPAVGTRGFAAYGLFAVFVLVPVTLYFYLFHGDWALLYWVDVRRIPSAVALIGFVAEVGVGALGFYAGAVLLRMQRLAWCAGLAVVSLLGAGMSVGVSQGRWMRVGSFAQFHGGFGLTPYFGSVVFKAGVALLVILAAAAAQLLWRLRSGGKKASAQGGPY